MKSLFYIKFNELHKKPKIGETQSLIWAFIASNEQQAIEMANAIGPNPCVMSSHQLNQYWR